MVRLVVGSAIVCVFAAAVGGAAAEEDGMTGKVVSEALPDRLVLDGVPRVGFYPKQSTSSPEDDPFPSCLRAWLQYRGDDEDMRRLSAHSEDPWHEVHTFLMGTSGAAFRLVWSPAWEGGSVCDIALMAADGVEPFKRALASVGYTYEMVFRSGYAQASGYRGEVSDDEALYRRRIMESIAAGKPAIAFGNIGPPEAGLVTGYDAEGDVLIGWSFFQEDWPGVEGLEFEPSGYYRQRHWFKGMVGLVTLGSKGGRPPVREVYREALLRGLAAMEPAEVRGRATGRAAYGAWAEALLSDEDFPRDDIETLRVRYMQHWSAGGMLAEARAWGGSFLRQAAEVEPAGREDLLAAADCFTAEHDLVWAVWEFAGGNGFSDEHARKFAEPTVRRRIVPLLRLALEKDEQAAEHIRRALGACKGQ